MSSGVALASTVLVAISVTTVASAAPKTEAPDKIFVVDDPALSIKDSILTEASVNPSYKAKALSLAKVWKTSKARPNFKAKETGQQKVLSSQDAADLETKLEQPVVTLPAAAKSAGISVSRTQPKATTDLGSVGGDQSDPGDLPIIGSSSVTSWTGMRLAVAGRFCTLLGSCTDTTDLMSARVNIDTGVNNMRVQWVGNYFPRDDNFDEGHLEAFGRYDAKPPSSGTDMALGNEQRLAPANTKNYETLETLPFINPPSINGQLYVYFAVKLWVQNPYQTYWSRGGRTGLASCYSGTDTPPVNCNFQ